MAYYKVRIEIWCDWDPENSDLEEIIREAVRREDAICTLQQVVTVVERPQDVGDDKAMSFFGVEEGRRTKPLVAAQDVNRANNAG